MVLKFTKALLRIFLFILLGICFSCEERGWIADCSECVGNEPREGYPFHQADRNELPVKVRVYQGEIEDSVLYAYSEISGEKYTPECYTEQEIYCYRDIQYRW